MNKKNIILAIILFVLGALFIFIASTIFKNLPSTALFALKEILLCISAVLTILFGMIAIMASLILQITSNDDIESVKNQLDNKEI